MKGKQKQKEYDKFLNEQLKIVRTACERCIIRIIEKYHKLEDKKKYCFEQEVRK